MACSTSRDHNKSYRYDVFLSFSGEDVRKTFIDHLYVALDQQGICTFKDDERLQKGKEINDELLQAIEDSRLYIIVFSKRYASSSWCLNELLKIMECHKRDEHTAFPVFYDVDPSEVRKQSGVVGEGLATHKNKSESEVEKWRKALQKAANLSGWDVRKTANGHEAKVIKLIVERVLVELRVIDVNVDDNIIGMEKRMQDLSSCLEIGLNDIRMIGIKGMGGAGKTTLARAIFDKISIQFEGKSFVENVRERASQSSLKKLQKQVLRDVCMDNNIVVSGIYEGKNLIKKKLYGKKVLVVLDDVDHKDQLEMLAGDTTWFSAGSRIIITTRDEHVLVAHQVKWIHDVNLLTKEEAICLFSRHAFGKDIPTQEYEKHSLEVVSYAAGLPLTIKVLGSNLCGKEASEWADVLKRLKTIPLKETLKILELSYENLEDDYKEIFLDVACFLRNWDKEHAIRMLESCGFYAKVGLKVLEQKSLIITSKDSYIRMHDHIVEMGKNIVCREHVNEPNKRSRLWAQEDIKHVLASDLVNEATKCIQLKISPHIALERLGDMKTLICLIVNYNGHVKIDEAHRYFPNSLQYLRWYLYPHWHLPKTFEANNLVSLEMPRSNIKQLWEGGKVMKNLKFLNLRYSNIRSLDLGMAPNLEWLDLQCCYDLVEVYAHGGCLKFLIYLNLNHCKSLKSFLFIKHFESLEVIHMDGFTEVPSSAGSLYEIKSLPGSICTLRHLRTLSLRNSRIEELHEDLDQLECLENLNLSLSHFKHFSRSFCMLKRLKTLLFIGCRSLEKLHEDIGQLESLERLDLSCCFNLREIPNNICKLKRLKQLNLEGCVRLKKVVGSLGNLECLQLLDIRYTGITHLPPNIRLLKGLKIYQSEWVDQISDDDFFQLCSKNDPTKRQIQTFQRLRILRLQISAIEELPEAVGHLECLEDLDLSHTDVKRLPDTIRRLKHLKNLCLNRCVLLEKLPDHVGQLESLEVLDLCKCYSIREIPSSICMLKKLKVLDLRHCFCLEKLPEDVGQLESLEELYLSRCYSIREIPSSIGMLKCLRKLDLEGCRRLEELPNELGDLECLQELTIWDTLISHLPHSISLLNGLTIYPRDPTKRQKVT